MSICSIFLFVGLLELDMGAWQKYALKYFVPVSIAMTAFACLTGFFTF